MKKFLFLFLFALYILFSNILHAQTWQQVVQRTEAQKTAGLVGGEGWQAIYSIAYAPSNPNTIYICADTNQVWKSTDGGATWQRKSNGFYANGALSLAVDPANENIVYAAGSVMGDWADVPGAVKGIFRTTDGGNNWTLVKACSFDTNARGGVHFAFQGSTIYAGCSPGGMLKSTDGIAWSLIAKNGGGLVLDTGVGYITDIQKHPTNSNIIYAVTGGTLYRVTDINGSATVSAIGSGLPTNAKQLQIDSSTVNNMYAACESSGCYKSTNAGISFAASNTGMSAPGGAVSRIAISSSNPSKLIYTWGYGVFGRYTFHSENGGASWTNTTSMDEQNANGWVAGSVMGWTTNMVGQSGTVPTVSIHPTNANIALISGFYEFIEKTTDGGITWRYSNSGYTGSLAGNVGGKSPIAWDLLNGSRATFNHADFGILKTENNEDTFTNISGASYLGAYAVHAAAMRGNIIVEAVGQYNGVQVFVSRDSGASWTAVPGTTQSSDIFCIKWHPTDPNIVYAGNYRFDSIQTNNNFTLLGRPVWSVFKGNGDIVYSQNSAAVFKSTDKGANWSNPYPSLGIPGGYYIDSIAVDPINQNRIYVAVSGIGIYIITDTSANGGTVQIKNAAHGLVPDRIGSIEFKCVETDPNNAGVVYATSTHGSAGHSNGIFRSIDSGASWTNINGNLGSDINIYNAIVNPFNSYVYIGSFAGSWKLPPPGQEPPPPSGGLPSITTGAATNVVQTTATLNATIIPNSLTTTARWQYGTVSGSYTLATGSQTISSSLGTSSTPITQDISSLSKGTQYFVRAQANNSSGSVNGSETAFATLSFKDVNIQNGTPTVNGDLGEYTLSNTLNVNIVQGTPTAYGSWSALWEGSRIVLAIQVIDSTLDGSYPAGQPWMADGLDFYFSMDDSYGSSTNGYSRHYSVSFNGTETFSAFGTTTGITVGTGTVGGGYKIEIGFPISVLGVGTLSAQSKYGFDIQLNDKYGTENGAYEWNNMQATNYFRTDGYGGLTLVNVASGASPIGTSTGMLSWWNMDDLTGTLTDRIGTSNATISGGTTTTTAGKGMGRVLSLDAVDDYALATNVNYGLNGTDTVSVAAWIYLNAETTRYVVGKQIAAGWNTFRIVIDANRQINWSPENQSLNQYPNWRATGSTTTNKWFHVATTFRKNNINASDAVIYINGVATTTVYSANSYAANFALQESSNPLVIGNQPVSFGFPFDGMIEDLRIYNTEIGTQTVLDLVTIGSCTVGVGSATNITDTSAILMGTVTPGGSSTFNGYFRYGLSSGSYTGTSTEQYIGSGTTQTTLSVGISGLGSGTTYFCVPVAYNASGVHKVGSETSFATLSQDITAPIGTVTINSGATYCNSTAITLNLTGSDTVGITGYYPSLGSTTPALSDPSWVSIATSTSYTDARPFTLPSGDGTKTVYLWFKDVAGNISTMIQDSIIYDSIFTLMDIQSPVSNTNLANGTIVFGTTGSFVNLGGIAYDLNGVSSVKISNNNTSTVNTATGTETWAANNQRVICSLDDGLLLYTKFDELNGVVKIWDSSSLANHGTNSGSSLGTLTVYGNSRFFDGVDDYIQIPVGASVKGLTQASISLWFYRKSIPANDVPLYFEPTSTSGNSRFAMWLNSNGFLTFSTRDTNTGTAYSLPGTITSNAWFHAVGVYDSITDNTTLWLNGAQIGTNSASKGAFTSDNPVYNPTIGLFSGFGGYVRAYIDDLRIYNRVLSASEITQLYTQTSPEIVNVFSATGFDPISNQGTDTIYMGNYAIPVTGTATSIGTSSATLTGSLTPNLANTCTAYFEIGTISTVYTGSTTTFVVNNPGTITVNNISLSSGTLTPNTEHFYRLSAVNTLGVTVGNELSFITNPIISVFTINTGGRWRYYGEFHKTDFYAFLKLNRIYMSFFKHIRSTQDWQDLIANPDLKLSSLPQD